MGRGRFRLASASEDRQPGPAPLASLALNLFRLFLASRAPCIPFRRPQTLRLGLSSAQLPIRPNAHCLSTCFYRRSRRLSSAGLAEVNHEDCQHGNHPLLFPPWVVQLPVIHGHSIFTSILRDDAIVLDALKSGSPDHQLMHWIRQTWGCYGLGDLSLDPRRSAPGHSMSPGPPCCRQCGPNRRPLLDGRVRSLEVALVGDPASITSGLSLMITDANLGSLGTKQRKRARPRHWEIYLLDESLVHVTS